MVGDTPLLISDRQRDLGVTIDVSLKFHHHVHSMVGRAGGVASSLLSGTVNRSPSFMKTLFVSHIRPLIEFASPVWNVGFVGDSKLIESVQRRWTREVWDIGVLDYGSRLRRLGLYSARGRRLRADLILVWRILHGLCPSLEGLLQRRPVSCPTTRGHSFKLFVPRCGTDVRKRFFSLRVPQSWNSLPESVVSSETLSGFKSGLHRALGDLLYEFD